MPKVMKSFLVVLVCIDLSLPISWAHVKHDIDEFLVEDQRTHMRKQNYVRQRAFEKDALNDGLGVAYTLESLDRDGPDNLPPLIVDYANMIRNDIILLDNSVQTRTRKRGDVQVEKFNQAFKDPPCSCEHNQTVKDLGEGHYPQFVEQKICSSKLCSTNYTCQPNSYKLTVLKRRLRDEQTSTDPTMPDILRRHWITKKASVIVGCVCMSDFIDRT